MWKLRGPVFYISPIGGKLVRLQRLLTQAYFSLTLTCSYNLLLSVQRALIPEGPL